MARFRRAQGAALAQWTEACRTAAEAPAAARHDGPTLDMEAPKAAGGAWTAPDQAGGPKPEAGPDLSAMMRALRETLPGAFPAGGAPAGRGAPVTVPPGARFEERTFADAAGSRRYKVYVPSGYRGQALPVIVMLHGCTQNPDDFAAGTRMNALAEERTFLVAYPEQPQSANMQRCWNWFSSGDQVREGGEPALIAGIARSVVSEFSADPDRVYAAGLSAGGAAAAILGATYPDLFAAVGIHSGLACGAARDMPGAFAAMKGQGPVPGRNRRAVPTIVFHGDGDRTVHPVNGDQVVAQAMPDSGLAEAVSRDTSPGGMAFTRTVRSDGAGRPLLEQWVLHGAGHAWSGGSPEGSYTDPRGPDASREMVRFFLAQAGDPEARG
ncbi:alpha/beta hydrolase family esterase [Methylobacterium sp. J-070]|uniref:extracellular catalytic domain type 1 short-chain-length polyhydroxyalkanoate depolymerase n=1 Tax=Methylobacterium sp. J-070 TaxID=2836650 RepID=UPI0039195603